MNSGILAFFSIHSIVCHSIVCASLAYLDSFTMCMVWPYYIAFVLSRIDGFDRARYMSLLNNLVRRDGHLRHKRWGHSTKEHEVVYHPLLGCYLSFVYIIA